MKNLAWAVVVASVLGIGIYGVASFNDDHAIKRQKFVDYVVTKAPVTMFPAFAYAKDVCNVDVPEEFVAATKI